MQRYPGSLGIRTKVIVVTFEIQIGFNGISIGDILRKASGQLLGLVFIGSRFPRRQVDKDIQDFTIRHHSPSKV